MEALLLAALGNTAYRNEVSLGKLNNSDEYSAATAVSGDGSIVVGISGDKAFIWDKKHGMRDLKLVLSSEYSINLTDKLLTNAQAISQDGNTIIGVGNPSEFIRQCWYVSLKRPQISHFHQLTNHVPEFRNRELLKQHIIGTSDDKFSVCADGTKNSIFKMENTGDTELKISEDLSGADVKKYGELKLIKKEVDSVVYSYTTPEIFPETNISSNFMLHLRIVKRTDNSLVEEIPLVVYRPPVLMVHGIWADASTFTVMKKSLIDSHLYDEFLLHVANYNQTSASSFFTNKFVVPTRIEKVIKSCREKGIAVGKVDIVVHSMGGLLTRTYLQSLYYKNDIHKFITCNTPHSGTQVADYIVDHPFLEYIISGGQNALAGRTHSLGAITDFKINSKAFEALNNPVALKRNTVPSHSIATLFDNTVCALVNICDVKTLQRSAYEASACYVRNSNFEFFPCQISDIINPIILYNRDKSDLIVPLASQQGGLVGNNTTVIEGQQMHRGAADYSKVIERVKELLIANAQGILFSQDGFNPPKLNPSGSLQRGVSVSLRNGKDSIKINTPLENQVFHSGNTINIGVSGTSGIKYLYAFADYNDTSNYKGFTTGPTNTFTFIVDADYIGKRTIYIYGISATSGDICRDTVNIYIESNSTDTLKDVKVNPSFLQTVVGESINFDVKGIYSGNKEVNINNIKGLSLKMKNGSADLDGFNLTGVRRGADTLTVSLDTFKRNFIVIIEDNLFADCTDLGLNIGASCDDNNPNTENDEIQSDCTCKGTPKKDCPILSKNIGEVCDDGDAATTDDRVTTNCECTGTPKPKDCPTLNKNIGDVCDDGNVNTIDDKVQADCTCKGTIKPKDCPTLNKNIGDVCDDGNANTIDDKVQADCTCKGTIKPKDCSTLNANIGDVCNDNNPNTNDDKVQSDCTCKGTLIPTSITINCPINISITISGNKTSAVVNYNAPTASSTCTIGTVTVMPAATNPASGSAFPIGTKTLSFTATDGCGNTSTCTFNVIVISTNTCLTDAEKPVFKKCPSSISLTTSKTCAEAEWDKPIVTDNCCDPSVSLATAPSVGLKNESCFPIGVTTVIYTATDLKGNKATCSFTVTVTKVVDPCTTDAEKPVFKNCPSNISLTITRTCATANWTAPTATDNCCDPSVSVTTTPTAGLKSESCFPIGVTTVTYTATDLKGNKATCIFTVTVTKVVDPCATDTEKPVFKNCPTNINLTVTSDCATANWTAPTATDNCGTPSISSNYRSGFCFPIGITTVKYKAEDKKGNEATCSFTITVTKTCATTLDPNKCYKIVNKNSGKLLDVFEAKMGNNVPIIQYSLNGGSNQKWQFSTIPNGFVKIKARHSSKYIACNDDKENAPVYQSDYSEGGTKDWKLECTDNGYYRIMHKKSGKYLSTKDNSKLDKAEIVIKNWNNSDAQKWKIEEVACSSTDNLVGKTVFVTQGRPVLNSIRLDWVENTAKSGEVFTIEKLINNAFQRLDVLKNIEGVGLRAYVFYDNNPAEGLNVYRINLLKNDGTVNQSPIIEVEMDKIVLAKVYPNPTDSYIDILFNNPSEERTTVKLFNILGVEVKKQTFESITPSLHVELGELPSGLYQLHVAQKGKRDFIKQIVIQR